VDGTSFNVEEGEIFGALGPNGAGKMTTVEIIEVLHKLDSSKIRVCGIDPYGNRSESRN
jgi:ABC-2 type transport system ATP-binding protein